VYEIDKKPKLETVPEVKVGIVDGEGKLVKFDPFNEGNVPLAMFAGVKDVKLPPFKAGRFPVNFVASKV
jgi:hypothetical protein